MRRLLLVATALGAAAFARAPRGPSVASKRSRIAAPPRGALGSRRSRRPARARVGSWRARRGPTQDWINPKYWALQASTAKLIGAAVGRGSSVLEVDAVDGAYRPRESRSGATAARKWGTAAASLRPTLRTIHVAAAAVPRPVSADYPGRGAATRLHGRSTWQPRRCRDPSSEDPRGEST